MGAQANVQEEENNEEIIDQQPNAEERPAGQSGEQRAADPTSSEVKSLYEDLGIKAPVPTGATKGRPKTADVRTKDAPKNGAGNSSSGQKADDADDKDKSKNAPASDKNGGSGNSSDSKGSKDKSDDDGVQDESGDANKGVRDSKSRDEKDSERGREEDSERGASGDESAEHDEDGKAEGESDDEEAAKRPGKSNPAVEKRMQQLANERKEAMERAEKLENELRQERMSKEQAKVAESDPEYKVEDFRMVRDNKTGEIKELSEEQAELAWRRWKDGYDQRAEQRQAEVNRQTAASEREGEIQRRIMKESVDAYDSLASLMDEYPELVSTSGKFDKDFAAEAMPIIQDAIEYLPGTEPGNPNDRLPIIVGMRIDPDKILKALKKVGNAKRTLPLNGVNDNVESRSNVAVPHSRSSDPTVHAANELYKDLGIDKRL